MLCSHSQTRKGGWANPGGVVFDPIDPTRRPLIPTMTWLGVVVRHWRHNKLVGTSSLVVWCVTRYHPEARRRVNAGANVSRTTPVIIRNLKTADYNPHPPPFSVPIKLRLIAGAAGLNVFQAGGGLLISPPVDTARVQIRTSLMITPWIEGDLRVKFTLGVWRKLFTVLLHRNAMLHIFI